jgi:DNA repair exonuclease SbcCD ATPase subunit
MLIFEALNSSNTIIEFFKSYGNDDILTKNDGWENYFENINHLIIKPSDSIPTQIKEKIDKKNDIVSKKIETESKTIKCNNNLLKIKEISFVWILAFGKDNRFKFSNNRISLINAPNGYGKSAFYVSYYVLGLFGEPIPYSRYMKSSSLSILNKRKKHKVDSSNIHIKFSLNNIDYSINRVFYEKEIKGVKRLQFVSIELFENDLLIKTSANLVNKWVHENICTVQDFLLSTVITQNFDNDFFKMKVTDQMELLDNVVHMDHINHICDVFKDAKK